MRTSATRRQMMKGAAWSAPIVVASTAAPTYAASHEYYGANQPQSGGTVYTATAPRTSRYAKTINQGGYQVQAINDAATTTATLTKLEYYYAINAVYAGTSAPVMQGNTATYWNAPVRLGTNVPLVLADGSSFAASNYVVFRMTFKAPGVQTLSIPQGGLSQILNGSQVNLVHSSQYGGDQVWYVGYIATYTTANGAQYTDQSTIAVYQPPAIIRQ